MAKDAPDYSFVRESVALPQWLWLLVGDDRAARRHAGEVLHAMQWGVPSPTTQLEGLDPIPDLVGQMGRFNYAVREALAKPSFDTAEFVRRLCAYRVAASDDWSRRVDGAIRDHDEPQYDRIAERLVRRINTSGDAAVKAEASNRLARALAAITARECRVDQEAYADAESMTSASMMSYAIFNTLDREFLAAPEALQLILEHRRQAHDAMKALVRIGPPAIAFAPHLLEQIDHLPSRPNYYAFDGAAALGAIGRGHAGIVDAVIERLRQPEPLRRAAAAETLEHMGTDVAGRGEIVLPLLHAMLDEQEATTWWSVARAVASVGRDDPRSRRRIIDLARARPPEWAEVADFPDQKYDRVMHERGVAIDAMVCFADYPDECVPVLIDAIETFEEYDPDQTYTGPIGRVSHVLASFGPAAGAAALPLARKLDAEPGEFPRAILDALMAMGSAAREAVPLLKAYRTRTADADEEPLVDWRRLVPDKDVDPVGWGLRQIGDLLDEK